MKISNTPRKQKGFTLVELMVSMAVTMVIISVLMAMTRVAVNGMTNAQHATRSSRLSQEVLNTVTKDLEAIVIRTGNTYEWVKVTEDTTVGASHGPATKEMKNPVEISFFSAVTDRYDGKIGTTDDHGGDISLVRYKLVYQDVIGGNHPVFSLYRKRVDPDVTFTTFLAQNALPAFGEAVTGDDFLAENIYDMTISFNFEVTTTNPDGSVITTIERIPVQVNGEYKSLQIKGNEVLVNGRALNGSARLASADISLLVLTDKGMNGIENTNEDLADYLRKHSKHYSKSVVLPRP